MMHHSDCTGIIHGFFCVSSLSIFCNYLRLKFWLSGFCKAFGVHRQSAAHLKDGDDVHAHQDYTTTTFIVAGAPLRAHNWLIGWLYTKVHDWHNTLTRKHQRSLTWRHMFRSISAISRPSFVLDKPWSRNTRHIKTNSPQKSAIGCFNSFFDLSYATPSDIDRCLAGF